MRLLLSSLLLAGLPCAHAQGPVLPAGTKFVMSHFKVASPQDERLYISVSPDGVNWSNLNGGQPVWQPANWSTFNNVVRDPAIIYHNGMYWVAFTSGNYGRHASFGLVKSQDLLNWTLVGEIACPIPGATDQLTWNPTFFREGDGTVRIFISISPDGGTNYSPVPNLRTYEVHPLNADWTVWSAPTQLALPSPNTNEFFCWREGDVYHGIYADFTASARWSHVTSSNPITGWSNERVLGFYSLEGGFMLKKLTGGYRFYLEPGGNNYYNLPIGYKYWECTDAFTGFGDYVQCVEQVPKLNGKPTAAVRNIPFAEWQAAKLAGKPAAQQTYDADPDGDSLTNLAEFALGLDPQKPDSLPTPSFITTRGGQPYLTMRYLRAPQAAGVSTTPQVSGNLSMWNPAEIVSVTLMSDGNELVEARDPLPLGDAPRFLRVRVQTE